MTVDGTSLLALTWLLCAAALCGAVLGALWEMAVRVHERRSPDGPTTTAAITPAAGVPTLKKAALASMQLGVKKTKKATAMTTLHNDGIPDGYTHNWDAMTEVSKTGSPVAYTDWQWGYRWCAAMAQVDIHGVLHNYICLQQYCPPHVHMNQTPEAQWVDGWWCSFNKGEKTDQYAIPALTVFREQWVNIVYQDNDGWVAKRMLIAGADNRQLYWHPGGHDNWEYLGQGTDGRYCQPNTVAHYSWNKYWVWARTFGPTHDVMELMWTASAGWSPAWLNLYES